MKTLILILLGLAYVLKYPVLSRMYPNVSVDYDQYCAFQKAQNIWYEFMFFGFFIETFLLTNRNTIMRSVACFFLILTGGSLIDKAIFDITQYLISDFVLIAIALAISIFIYVRKDT